MAKLSKEEFLNKLKAYTGDRTDDETLSIIEDASDSFTEDNGSGWEAKYNDLAKKYKDRFTDKIEVKEEDPKEDPKDDDDNKEDITVDDLFKEE